MLVGSTEQQKRRPPPISSIINKAGNWTLSGSEISRGQKLNSFSTGTFDKVRWENINLPADNQDHLWAMAVIRLSDMTSTISAFSFADSIYWENHNGSGMKYGAYNLSASTAPPNNIRSQQYINFGTNANNVQGTPLTNDWVLWSSAITNIQTPTGLLQKNTIETFRQNSSAIFQNSRNNYNFSYNFSANKLSAGLGNSNLKVDIAEVFFGYSNNETNITYDLFQKLQGYLNEKYALLALPSTHPYNTGGHGISSSNMISSYPDLSGWFDFA